MKRNTKSLNKSEQIIRQIAKKAGARNIKIINPQEVETATWVRYKCQFGCSEYGSSLVCPPYTPTPEQTRKMLDGYQKAVLFEADRYDVKKIAIKIEKDLFLKNYYKAFALGAGPCEGLCKECSFDEGCRYPDESRPSMEGCGIDVFSTVRKFGYKIDVVKDNIEDAHFFGLVLIE